MKHCEACQKPITDEDAENGNLGAQRVSEDETLYTHQKCPLDAHTRVTNALNGDYRLNDTSYRPGTGFRVLQHMINEMEKEEVWEYYEPLKLIQADLVKDLENEYRAGFKSGFKMAGGK